MPFSDKIISLSLNKKTKQIIALSSSLVISMILGIVVSMLNTRILKVETYGNYRLIISYIAFCSPFLSIGLFKSISRIGAVGKIDKRNLTGVSIVIFLLLSVVFYLFIYFSSYTYGKIYSSELGQILRVILILSTAYILQEFIIDLLTGINEVYKLSQAKFAFKAIYIIIILYLIFIKKEIELLMILYIFLGSYFVVYILILISLKPIFKNINQNIKTILHENKKFGFPVYASQIANTGTGQIAALLIGYFISSKEVGLYTLSITITNPLIFLPSVIGTVYFKEFASYKKLPAKQIKLTVVFSVISIPFFWILITYVFPILYQKSYIYALNYVYFISISVIIRGIADYFNKFISAQGNGVALRNASFIIAIINIIGLLLCVSAFGVYGAIFIRILTSFVYLILMIKIVKTISKKNNIAE